MKNLLNVPTMNGFTPKDWALFMGEAAMGASGSDAANVVSGISHMIHGDYLQGIKEILPRLLRDPVKAHEFGTDRGLIDSRGKPMLSRDKISGWNVASQALGFVPANVADAREGRQGLSRERARGRNDRDTRLTQKYVSAAPADRPAIWAQIQQFNADPANRSIRINRDQLLQQINQRRKITTQPGAFGLQLPKEPRQGTYESGKASHPMSSKLGVKFSKVYKLVHCRISLQHVRSVGYDDEVAFHITLAGYDPVEAGAISVNFLIPRSPYDSFVPNTGHTSTAREMT